MVTPIVPSDANPSSHPSSTAPCPASGALYEIVPQHALPTFNPHSTLKHKVLPKWLAHRYNRFMFKRRLQTTAFFNIGTVVSVISLVLPPSTGQLVALLVPCLQFLAVISVLMPSRPEMWAIIIKTFDFWFLTASNVAFFACFALLLSDGRIVVLVMRLLFQQGAIMTDASVTKSKHVAAGAFIDTLVLILYAVLVGFGFIDDSNRVVLFRYAVDKHAMSTRDLLLNAIMTLVIVLGSLVYRHLHGEKHKAARARRQSQQGESESSTVFTTCVLYRCDVRLQEVNGARSERAIGPSTTSCLSPGYVRLQLHQKEVVYDSSDTVIAWLAPRIALWLHGLQGWPRMVALLLLYGTGMVGFVLCVLCSLSSSSSGMPSFIGIQYFPAATLISTASFCGVFSLFCQRQLLWRLVTSFDYLFMEFNLVATHVCLAAITGWAQQQCLGWSLVIWLQWVARLDTVTPATRSLLHFRPSWAVAVLAMCVASHVAAALHVFVWDTWRTEDHVIMRVNVRGVTRQLHILPVLLSRLVTVISFSIRLLWRMSQRAHDNDCVFLRGVVAYEYEAKASQAHGVVASK